MSITYTTYVTQTANLMAVSSVDPNYTNMLPGMIDYAEQRLYRELDLLATRVPNRSVNLTPGNQQFSLSTTAGTFLVVERINVITPTSADFLTGSRTPLTEVSPDFINITYPSYLATQGVPEFWSLMSDNRVILGPTPDSSYNVEVYGTIRPTPLSAANSSTILTQMLPDLFIAASMVFAFGYMRDFGGQSDNPQAAQSWEAQTKLLMQSALVEEFRKKYQSQGWTDKIPTQTATPPRV